MKRDERIHASKFFKALDDTKLEYAAVSWGGYAVFGDHASIEEFKRLQALADKVPALQERLRTMQTRERAIGYSACRGNFGKD